MLCALCDNIFLGSGDIAPCENVASGLQAENRRVHHSLSALNLSASSGCDICSRLWALLTSQMYRKAWSEAQSLVQTHLHNACTLFFVSSNGQSIHVTHRIWVTNSDDPRSWSEKASLFLSHLQFDPAYQASGPGFEDNCVDWVKTHDGSPLVCKEVALSMSWSQILTWLRQCEQQHGRCRGPLKMERRLPTRLLDLGTGKSRKGLRLCTAHGLPQDTRYMTLSHRWGDEQAARLLSRNLDAFMESIEEASLPSTFREAIMITRRLGIRYLWIDSICIRQDADDLSDWQTEAGQMHAVYGQSYLNLAASASNSAYGGLLRQRNAALLRPCHITVVDGEGAEHEYICDDKGFFKAELHQSPLHSRAWVLQEVLLAPRTLSFASAQLYWRCSEVFACERWTWNIVTVDQWPGVHRSLLHTYDSQTSLDQEWIEIRQQFMEADLTFNSDRLAAFSGIAQHFLQRYKACGHPQRYLAGMWESELIPALLWDVVDSSDDNICPRPKMYQAPSWSWASIDGKTRNPSQFLGPDIEDLHVVRVVEASVTPILGNEYTGFLKTAYLRMEVPTIWAEVRSGPVRKPFTKAIARYLFDNGSLTESLSVDLDEGWQHWGSAKEVLLANVASKRVHVPQSPHVEARGLLLLLSGDSSLPDAEVSFNRIGTWCREFKSIQVMQDDPIVQAMLANIMTIKIV